MLNLRNVLMLLLLLFLSVAESEFNTVTRPLVHILLAMDANILRMLAVSATSLTTSKTVGTCEVCQTNVRDCATNGR
jgi:hypothetical protein